MWTVCGSFIRASPTTIRRRAGSPSSSRHTPWPSAIIASRAGSSSPLHAGGEIIVTTRGIQAVRGHLAKLPPASALTIEQRRAQYDRAERLSPTPADVRIELVAAPDRPAEWLAPPGVSADTVVLYLHGGGYVIGSPRSHRHLAAAIARAAGARALVLD